MHGGKCGQGQINPNLHLLRWRACDGAVGIQGHRQFLGRPAQTRTYGGKGREGCSKGLEPVTMGEAATKDPPYRHG
jgi:hypothetical protein